MSPLSRRRLLALGAALPLAAALRPAAAAERPLVTVWKDPWCGCCTAWAEHLEAAGFPVRLIESSDVAGRRALLGVPAGLAGCHTAEVAGYAVEGHVPAEAVDKLLAERPAVAGLAVPGMPIGSPGMPSDQPQTYDVLAFGRAGGVERFMRFRGPERIAG
ncbi:DUF411 domain-containing protein [Geminicoccaceae bacterium 1502E]|nr:DUF411 domain-containing protein [Geminicoccaceae bacterium 1502E]